ncbi:MAG: hypothetical protein ACPHIA_01125 [Alphaproteobacteria bacterium]
MAQLAADDAAAQARIAEIKRLGTIEEQRREDLLRQELASRRAHFAGRGLSPAEGSAAAVLGGLVEESKQASAEDAYLRNAEIREIENARLARGRINLLQAANARARGGLQSLQRGIPFSYRLGTSLLER